MTELRTFTDYLFETGEIAKLGGDAVVVYLAIRHYVAEHKGVFPKRAILKKMTGLVFTRIDIAIKSLINENLIYLGEDKTYCLREKHLIEEANDGAIGEVVWDAYKPHKLASHPEFRQVFIRPDLADGRIVHIEQMNVHLGSMIGADGFSDWHLLAEKNSQLQEQLFQSTVVMNTLLQRLELIEAHILPAMSQLVQDPPVNLLSATDSIAEQQIVAELAKHDLAKHELAKHELAKQELAQQELAQQELAKQELAKYELAKYELAKHELAKHELAKHELAKQELAKQELAKQELAKQELAKQELAKQELAQQELAQQELAQQKSVSAHVIEQARNGIGSGDRVKDIDQELSKKVIDIYYAQYLDELVKLEKSIEALRAVLFEHEKLKPVEPTGWSIIFGMEKWKSVYQEWSVHYDQLRSNIADMNETRQALFNDMYPKNGQEPTWMVRAKNELSIK